MDLLNILPSWVTDPASLGVLSPSTWSFTTSEGTELDALVVAFGKGSFFITDSSDPDGIVHEVLYVGVGATTSKGGIIPFSIGGSISNVDLPSGGPILLGPGTTSMSAEDFGGFGIIFSCFGGGTGFGANVDVVLFHGPLVRAVGIIGGAAIAVPGIGATAMPCWMVIDP